MPEIMNIAITSCCEHLPRYHYRVASIVSQIVVILMNRVLSDRLVNWPCVSGWNYPKMLVMVLSLHDNL